MLVVIAVMAESALEKLAATIPMVKIRQRYCPCSLMQQTSAIDHPVILGKAFVAFVPVISAICLMLKQQVGWYEGKAIRTHIFLGITKRLAGEILLHHVLIKSRHDYDHEYST